MQLWLLLTAAFIVQEPISSSAVLLEAYQNHYNVWIIHGIFVAATLFDIVVSYYLGVFIHRRYGQTRLISYLKRKFEFVSGFMGRKGKAAAIILFVPMLFPLSGIVLPWFEVSLSEAIVYIFIGECIFWYAYVWLLVLGVKALAHDSQIALYGILAVSILISVCFRLALKKMGRRPPSNG